MTASELSIWGDIANIVIAVASVATAIVTAIVLCKQHKLQKKQHELDKEKLISQHIEHQPIFSISATDSSLTITNEGYEVVEPINIKSYTIILSVITRVIDGKWNNYVHCSPISMYKTCNSTGNLKGIVGRISYKEVEYKRLIETTDAIKNHLMNQSNMPKSQPLDYVNSVQATNLIEIQYVDMYGENMVVFYLGSTRISKERYMQLSHLIFKNALGVTDVNNFRVIDFINKTYKTTEIYI